MLIKTFVYTSFHVTAKTKPYNSILYFMEKKIEAEKAFKVIKRLVLYRTKTSTEAKTHRFRASKC